MGITRSQAMSSESTARLADLATQWRDSQETARTVRHRLYNGVVAAIDEEGASTSEVAKVIGVSPTRVYAIIAAAYTGTG